MEAVLLGVIFFSTSSLHSKHSYSEYYNLKSETNMFLVEVPHYLNKATAKSWRWVTTLLLGIPPYGGPCVSLRVTVRGELLPREGVAGETPTGYHTG